MLKITTTRRSFIKKLFASLSGGIALSSAGKLFAEPHRSSKAQSSTTESQGYRETEHIRNYYDSARY